MPEKEGGRTSQLKTTAIPENGHWRLRARMVLLNADASVIMLLRGRKARWRDARVCPFPDARGRD